MRQLVALAICSSIAMLGCTKRNPEVCCVTDAECKAVGFDSPSPCGEGVCVQNSCVAAGTSCDDDGDCTDPAAPMCVSGQCYGEVEACQQGGGQRIVFASLSYQDKTEGLYSVYVNGSGRTLLTSDFKDSDVHVNDLYENGDSTEIPEINIAPSPDGETIAYFANSAMATIGIDGSRLTQITDGSLSEDHVEWSPDGTKLTVSTAGDPAAYIIHADGSSRVQLFGASGASPANYDPTWASDSSMVAFASKAGDTIGIYTANANGTEVKMFDGETGQFVTDGISFGDPRWAPNRFIMAYITDEGGDTDVALKRADGSNVNILATTDSDEGELAWSHDSLKLVFVRRGISTGSKHVIWVMNADGTNQIPLTDSNSNAYHPRWSADDHYILFDTDRDGNREIYRMDSDGANQINVSNAPGQDGAPIQDYGAEWVACPQQP
jgi:TolB protein